MPLFGSGSEGQRTRNTGNSVWGAISLSNTTPPSPGMPLLAPPSLRPPSFSSSAGDLTTVNEAADNQRNDPTVLSISFNSGRPSEPSPSPVSGSRFRIVSSSPSTTRNAITLSTFGQADRSSTSQLAQATEPDNSNDQQSDQSDGNTALTDSQEGEGILILPGVESQSDEGAEDEAPDLQDGMATSRTDASAYPMIPSSLTASYPLMNAPPVGEINSPRTARSSTGWSDISEPAPGIPVPESQQPVQGQPARGVPVDTPDIPTFPSSMGAAVQAEAARAMAIPAEDEAATGLPTVLGVPVGIADSPLPDNCCEQKCRCIDWSPSVRFRRVAFITSMLLSFFLVLLGVGVDILGSEPGIRTYFEGQEVASEKQMPAYAPYFMEHGYPGSGSVRVPAEYVAFCQINGQAPTRTPLIISFVCSSILFTILGTFYYIVIARGCSLCCAPCLNDDKTCRTNTMLAFAFIFLSAGVAGHLWMLIFTIMDLANCESCQRDTNWERVESARECAQGFNLHFLQWGISTVAGISSAIAVHFAGRFCREVPLAIQTAVRFKARQMVNMHRRVAYQAILPTLSVPPIQDPWVGGRPV